MCQPAASEVISYTLKSAGGRSIEIGALTGIKSVVNVNECVYLTMYTTIKVYIQYRALSLQIYLYLHLYIFSNDIVDKFPMLQSTFEPVALSLSTAIPYSPTR